MNPLWWIPIFIVAFIGGIMAINAIFEWGQRNANPTTAAEVADEDDADDEEEEAIHRRRWCVKQAVQSSSEQPAIIAKEIEHYVYGDKK